MSDTAQPDCAVIQSNEYGRECRCGNICYEDCFACHAWRQLRNARGRAAAIPRCQQLEDSVRELSDALREALDSLIAEFGGGLSAEERAMFARADALLTTANQQERHEQEQP